MAKLSLPALFLAFLGLSRAQRQIHFGPNNPPERPSIASIPALGFGTWNLDKSNASEAVSLALQTGYRHLDCAAVYGNEKEVGKGIKDGLATTGLHRSSVWITSKLWNDQCVSHILLLVLSLHVRANTMLYSHQTNQVEQALDTTLSDLGLEYLDLYLMHWPVASSGGKNYIDYVDVGQNVSSRLKLCIQLTCSSTDLARHGKASGHRQSSTYWSLQFFSTSTTPAPRTNHYQASRSPI